jgi:exosortase
MNLEPALNMQGRQLRQRLLYLAVWLGLTLLLFWKPASKLIVFSLRNDTASHILVIPFISAYVIFTDRRSIFRRLNSAPALCFVLASFGFAISVWQHLGLSSTLLDNYLSANALSIVLCWAAGFALLFGWPSFRMAAFPLLLLLLMIPLPESLLQKAIYFLQEGSADIAEIVFDLFGVPALREGFVFRLAHINIEVAQECSGIRSSIALVILALLVAHSSFSKFWKKAVFVIAGLVMMVVKNGVRIATLTILASYVDPGFLYGRLHREGGVVFFLIGLTLLLPVYWLLRRGEGRLNVSSSEGTLP